jgi:hypothetical protein
MEMILNQPLNDSGVALADNGSTTEWRVVPGYPEFIVNQLGEIKENHGPARIRVAGSGHIYVLRSHSRAALLVHRAILLAFVGEPRIGDVARHLNDNPADNRLANLKWGTKKENAEDRVRNAPIKHEWTGERRLLERIKVLEVENMKLKLSNMKLKAAVMNLMADRSTKITQSLLSELGL